MLKLGGSAPSSGPFRLAACVLGTGQNSMSIDVLSKTFVDYLLTSYIARFKGLIIYFILFYVDIALVRYYYIYSMLIQQINAIITKVG